MAVSSSISITIAHAISFLTRPLLSHYPATTLVKLQMVLEANLTAHYAPTWVPNDPLRGSGRRCLTLSPDCLPPRVIYAACIATGVQWFDWIARLGGAEFDFFVDPGCVSIRLRKRDPASSRIVTVWADELPSPAPMPTPFGGARAPAKTFAQQLMEYDNEEEERLFSMIANEVRSPTWSTPVTDRFPISIRSISPMSDSSRCSSRSSNSSGGFSAATSSASSISTASSSFRGDEKKLSRRERARQARVFVDASKNEVTPYDGGKTTVLTGGVMLGGAPKKVAKFTPPPVAQPNTWRAIRV